jgi:hypothetical protein
LIQDESKERSLLSSWIKYPGGAGGSAPAAKA